MRTRRFSAAFVLTVVGLLVAAPRQARAQDVECDPGDQEVMALRFEGNHAFGADELGARINTTASSWARRRLRFMGARACLDRAELPRDMVRLQYFYRSAGYYDVKVDTAVTQLRPGEVRVTFRIDEGQPILIDSVTFDWATPVADSARVTRDLWIAPGRPLDVTRLKADADSMVARLRGEGYPRAEVIPLYTVDRAAHAAPVTMSIVPGAHARFGEFVYEVTPADPRDGQQIDDRTIADLMHVKPGQVYSDKALLEAQRNLFQTGAYRHVEVAADSSVVDSVMPLHVRLLEDNMHELNTELGWGTLDCFRARGQLINKNFLGGARRLELTGQLSKLGYGRPTRSPLLSNLCGALRNDQIGSDTVNFYAGATFRPLTWFGPAAAPTFTLYTERRSEYQAYLRRTYIGGEASVTRSLGRLNTPLRAGYTMEYGRTDAPPAVLCAVFQRCDVESQLQVSDARPLGVASVAIARVRTDNPLSATRGSVLRVDLRSSSTLLGSANELTFNKGLFDAAVYLPGGWGNVIALRGRAGLIGGGADAGGARLPPPQERFYAGGPGSVRGFQQNELGAAAYIAAARCGSVTDAINGNCAGSLHADSVGVDGDGNPTYRLSAVDRNPSRVVPVGGNALVIANMEYRFRDYFFPELIQYTAFMDAGEVWTRAASDSTFRYTGLKWTPGLGVRVFTPFGPVQVNIGYNANGRVAGPAFYESPVNALVTALQNKAPLFCVSPGNSLLVSRSTETVGGQTTYVYSQEQGACPGSYLPRAPKTFLNHLTFTFSIGPDF